MTRKSWLLNKWEISPFFHALILKVLYKMFVICHIFDMRKKVYKEYNKTKSFSCNNFCFDFPAYHNINKTLLASVFMDVLSQIKHPCKYNFLENPLRNNIPLNSAPFEYIFILTFFKFIYIRISGIIFVISQTDVRSQNCF